MEAPRQLCDIFQRGQKRSHDGHLPEEFSPLQKKQNFGLQFLNDQHTSTPTTMNQNDFSGLGAFLMAFNPLTPQAEQNVHSTSTVQQMMPTRMNTGFPHQNFVQSPEERNQEGALQPNNNSMLHNDSGIVHTADGFFGRVSAKRSHVKNEGFTVQGRLTHPGNVRDYEVTVDEIKRRISYPELLNNSCLTNLLRRAKTKDSGVELKRHLEDFTIQLPHNRRKRRRHTAFSVLVESESINMSRDLDVIVNSEDYPTDGLAQRMAIGTGTQAYAQRRKMLTDTMQFFCEMSTLYQSVHVSVAGAAPVPQFRSNLDQAMEIPSALTHGFVIQNQLTWAVQFAEIAKQALLHLDSRQNNQQQIQGLTTNQQ